MSRVNVSDWLARANVMTGSTGKPTVSESAAADGAGAMPPGTAGPTGQEPPDVLGYALTDQTGLTAGFMTTGESPPAQEPWSMGAQMSGQAPPSQESDNVWEMKYGKRRRD